MKHKIICGDCIEVMPTVQNKSIDMILTDLPYGITACSWDTQIPLKPLWKEWKRIIKDNGTVVLTSSQPFTSLLVMNDLKMFKYEIIWRKNTSAGFIHAKNKPLKKHENILIFSYGTTVHKGQSENRMTYNPQGLIKNKKIYKRKKTNCVNIIGKRPSHKLEFESEFSNYPISIIETLEGSNNLFNHPTQKPLVLFEYLIKTYTYEDNLVLDSCLGSGTTSVAAERLNRNSIGIEISKEYCDLSYERLLSEVSHVKIDREPSIIERIGF